MKFEEIKKENKAEYWQKIDKEFGFSAELFSNYFKKINQEKRAEDIVQEWLQELMDWRADRGISPIQSPEKDISDLKELLTIKAEGELQSDKATADSCYYNHLLLLNLGTSEIQRNPDFEYKNDSEIDHDNELETHLNDSRKKTFYDEALAYLLNSSDYNKNEGANRYSLKKQELDSDALLVLDKLQVLDSFYSNRHYYHFENLPAFVADKMIKNGQHNDLYYNQVFKKFNSFSDLVAKNMFNNGASDIITFFIHDFERLPETDPLWALDKILKCDCRNQFKELLLIDFVNKNIKSSQDVKEAYKLLLFNGVSIKDENISDSISQEDWEEYLLQRDKFSSDINLVFYSDKDNFRNNNIHDLEKFYEMADAGYGPILIEKTKDINYFDNRLMIEKLQKNKQSYYLIYNYGLQDSISPTDLVDSIIKDGDIDVLVANINRINNIERNEDNLLKLWNSGYDQAVKNNIKRFSNLSEKFLRLLIDLNEDDLVIYNLNSFELNYSSLKLLIDTCSNRLADGDINLKKLEEVGLFDYFLETVKDPETFKKLRYKGFLELSTESMNKFAVAVSKTEAFETFIEHGIANSYLMNLDFEVSVNDFNKIIEKNINAEFIISFIESVKNKPADSFYVQNIEVFTNRDNKKTISFFMELLNGGILTCSKEDLNLVLASDNNLAMKLIEFGAINYLTNNLDKFKELDQKVAEKLIETGKATLVLLYLDRFNNLSRDFGLELIKLLNTFSQIVKVNEYYSPSLDKMVDKTTDVFGPFASNDSYNIITGISNNDREVIEKLKLKRGGNDGLRELQERFYDFKKEIVSEDFNPEVLLDKDSEFLQLPFFKSYVRYEEARFGNNNQESLQKIINDYKNYKNKSESIPLNPNFKPSQELNISKSDLEARKNHQFNEHFLNRFSVLVNSIKTAKNLYHEKFPLSGLVTKIEEKRSGLIESLKEKSDKMPNLRAKEGLDQKISALESLKIRNVKDFQDNFSVLAANKEFNELLRQVSFLISFSKNKQSLNHDLDSINLDKPGVDDISWVLDFVDHITNRETMSQYFSDKKAGRMFSEVVSAQAISEEMVLLQDKGERSEDVTKIQLIPTRSVLMEFSGHIADACWASKYNSILEEFPNFTSVIIKQNPDSKYERLAGAFMLIETKSKNDEPLLVIRGFNPIENLINSVSAKDFYNKVTGYVKELAEKDKRKVAIVIDDHTGGAATNRPVLFKYLSELSKSLEAVDLKSEDDTSFNSYNIVRKTYLLP